jgi:hypothetical protein
MGHVSIPRMSLSSCLTLTLCFAPLSPAQADRKVGLPYARARLQDYYERLGGGPNREELNEENILPRTFVCPPPPSESHYNMRICGFIDKTSRLLCERAAVSPGH